jgi:hypothetical protein
VGEGSDNQTGCTQWGQPELCGGLHLPPMGTNRGGSFAGTHEESLRANPRTQARRLPVLQAGGLENLCDSTGRRDVLAGGLLGGAAFQVTGWGGRPRVLPVFHPGTASSSSLNFTGSSSLRWRLYRWVWIHTPSVCSRSES